MITLFRNNRNPLTLLVCIVTFVLMYLCYLLENQSSTIIQWIIFAAGLLCAIYLQFSDLEDDVEYPEENYELADHRAQKIIQELDERDNSEGFSHSDPIQISSVSLQKVKNEDIWIDENSSFKIDGDVKKWHGKTSMDLSPLKESEPIKRTVFVVQPITITQEEFNEKFNQNNNMETNKPSAVGPAPKAEPQKEQPIVSYSLHGIPQKWRAMVDDICSYATRGEKKKLEDIVAKIAIYGHPYQTERKYHNLVAFKFDFIRIPAVGYFGIKTKEEEK